MGLHPSVMMTVGTSLISNDTNGSLREAALGKGSQPFYVLKPALKGAMQQLARNISAAVVQRPVVKQLFSNVIERKPVAVSQSHFLSQMGTTNLRTLESLFAVYTRLLDFRVQR